MSTSGSIDFAVTRDELVKYALMQIGIVGEGETPTSAQYTEGSFILNMLTKARMADGMPLWALKTGYLLPTTDTATISVGGNFVTSFVNTTTSAAASSGASTITVTSATGFATTYAIGIEQSDSTMHWTTINGAPVGTTITLTAALTEDVASGANVYCYNTSNRCVRPLRVIGCYQNSISGENRWQMNYITKDQYLSLGNPNSQGTPNQLYYDPQLTTGVFSIYPQFLGGDNYIQVTFHRPFEDFDASTDTPDFPQEWYLSLMLDLAALLGARNGVTLEERKALQAEAKAWRDLALENGTEEGSFLIQPNSILLGWK